MTQMSRITNALRSDLDRAAAVVLALGVIIFAFSNGLHSIWAFFSPIFGAFTKRPEDLGGTGLGTQVADLCFLAAAILFSVARLTGFWSHYRTMPLLYWATGDAAKRRSGRRPQADQTGAAQEDFDEAPIYAQTRGDEPSPEEEVDPEPSVAGPSWRERLAYWRGILGEQRVGARRPGAKVSSPTLLIGRTGQAASNGAPQEVEPESEPESPQEHEDEQEEFARYEEAEQRLRETKVAAVAEPAAPEVPERQEEEVAPLPPIKKDPRDQERDFEQDPDFVGGGAPAGDLDEWLSELDSEDKP
jgi:hypothetical protein